jgi:hypothetical protein
MGKRSLFIDLQVWFLSDSFVQQKITYDFEKGGYCNAESQILVTKLSMESSASARLFVRYRQLQTPRSGSILKLGCSMLVSAKRHPIYLRARFGWAKGSDGLFFPVLALRRTTYTYDSGLL